MPWGACLLLRAFERPLARPAAVHLQALRAVDPRGPLRPLPLARRRCPAAMAAVVASASAEGEGESFHDREGCRFGVRMGGEEAYVSYAISDADRTIDILSTFTPVSLRGKGLASKVWSRNRH